MKNAREDICAGTGHTPSNGAAQASRRIWTLVPGLQNQTNQLVNVEALLPVGFENTDKKTAQEVPLLFQGPAFILLHVQVCLGRQQPQGLPTGPEPRLPETQHTPRWEVLALLQGQRAAV